MTVTAAVARIRVTDLDAALPLYEALAGAPARRFRFGSAELAAVGPLLLFHAPDPDGDRLAGVVATLATDDLDRELTQLRAHGGEVVASPAPTPHGRRSVVRHPDGAVFEYVGR